MTPLHEKDDPAGALYKCSDNGWINEHLSLQWLTHFKQHAKPSTAILVTFLFPSTNI
ncbi:hypothetical protein KGM_209343A, partial [Danaus plexippus plexippus]